MKTNANSIKNITGLEYDLNDLTKRLINLFKDFDIRFNQNSIDEIKSKYLKNLYGYNSFLNFSHKDNEFKGKIIDIISDKKIKISVNEKEIVFDSRELKQIF